MGELQSFPILIEHWVQEKMERHQRSSKVLEPNTSGKLPRSNTSAWIYVDECIRSVMFFSIPPLFLVYSPPWKNKFCVLRRITKQLQGYSMSHEYDEE